jgi:trimethylamine--corrinoid protein Co-methyltransferase
MAEVAVGGADQLRINPTAVLYINVTSAFRQNEESLHKLMHCAEKHVPCVYLPDVQRGVSGPITIAGAMACCNAGQLVGLVISQLVSEGAPIILNTAMPTTMDMKTMTMPYASLMSTYFLELNHYYNLPSFNYAGCSDSKLLDEQAAIEAAVMLQMAIVSGGNMIHNLGYLESGLTGSLEQLAICDEIVSWIKSCMKGLEITEETLALDLIHDHALSGDFLGTDHTVRHVREDWQPRLFDRQNYSAWEASGGESMRERAKTLVDEILGAEPGRILPPEVEKRINKIADKSVTVQCK